MIVDWGIVTVILLEKRDASQTYTIKDMFLEKWFYWKLKKRYVINTVKSPGGSTVDDLDGK